MKAGMRIVAGRMGTRERLSSVCRVVSGSSLGRCMGRGTGGVFVMVTRTRTGIRNAAVSGVRFRRINTVSSVMSMMDTYVLMSLLYMSGVCTAAIPMKSKFMGYSRNVVPMPTPTAVRVLGSIPVGLGAIGKRYAAPAKTTVVGALYSSFMSMLRLRIGRVNCKVNRGGFRVPGVLEAILNMGGGGGLCVEWSLVLVVYLLGCVHVCAGGLWVVKR